MKLAKNEEIIISIYKGYKRTNVLRTNTNTIKKIIFTISIFVFTAFIYQFNSFHRNTQNKLNSIINKNNLYKTKQIRAKDIKVKLNEKNINLSFIAENLYKTKSYKILALAIAGKEIKTNAILRNIKSISDINSCEEGENISSSDIETQNIINIFIDYPTQLHLFEKIILKICEVTQNTDTSSYSFITEIDVSKIISLYKLQENKQDE